MEGFNKAFTADSVWMVLINLEGKPDLLYMLPVTYQNQENPIWV